MFREVDRRAEVRRAVHAVDEALHHVARDQLEVADPRQDCRIDEASAGECLGFLHNQSLITNH
jgi:hypothetical protein